MLALIKFSMVAAFSIGIGILCALGTVRFTQVEELQRPLSQVFILGVFLILAYKAGWLNMAHQAWARKANKRSLVLRVARIAGLCVLGVALGLLMRLGIQGGILLPLKILSPGIYSEESRDLVSLWQNSQEFSLSRLALFAMGATREEIMYRFVILGAMMKIFGPLRAVIFSALIFSAVHLNPVTFIAGTIFACVFIISRSLLLLSVMHTAANSWHTVVAKFNLVPESIEPTDVINSPYGFILMISAAILIIVAFSFMLLYLKRSSTLKPKKVNARRSRGIDSLNGITSTYCDGRSRAADIAEATKRK